MATKKYFFTQAFVMGKESQGFPGVCVVQYEAASDKLTVNPKTF
jgi:hypothetical protein